MVKKKVLFFQKNIQIDLEIETVNLDRVYNLKNLRGNLDFIDEELKKQICLLGFLIMISLNLQ